MNPQDNQDPNATIEPQPTPPTQPQPAQVDPTSSVTQPVEPSPTQPKPQPAAAAPTARRETIALVALIMAIFSVFLPILPLATIIVAIVALVKINKNQSGGKGMAIAALVIAIAAILVQMVLFVIVVQTAAIDIQSRAQDTQQSSNNSSQNTSSSSQANPIDNSGASEVLRKDLLKAIYIKEVASGRTGSIAVVSVTKLPKQGTTFVEEWVVEVGGIKTTYTIRITPTSDGGSDYVVTEKT